MNDINIDASNATRMPFTKKLSTFYFLIDYKLRKSYEVLLKEADLITTEGFLFQQTTSESTYQLDSIIFDLNTFDDNYRNSSNIGFVDFLASNIKTY